MARTIQITILLAVSLVMAVSCKGFSDIEVLSFEVESVSPSGLRAAQAVIQVGLHNPTVGFTVRDFTGALKMDSAPIVHFTSGSVKVDGHRDKVYSIPVAASLSDGVSIFQLLPLLSKPDLSRFSVDIQATGELKGGIGKTLVFNDIPISGLIEGI